jgi:GNAT superfamily N-acetyltransferase
MDSAPLFRPSQKVDGDAMLEILDANVIWMNKREGGGQWGPKLFSESSNGGKYWRTGGEGDIINEDSAQKFVLEVNDWDTQEGEMRRVGGWVTLSTKNPHYGCYFSACCHFARLKIKHIVPKISEPQIYISMAAIHPALRHKGMGKAMVDGIKGIAKAKHWSHIRLDCWGGNTYKTEEGAMLVKAWERLGFVKTHQVTPEGEPRQEGKPWQQVLELKWE